MAACTAQDILKIAKGELGVKESPAGSNKVKYNTAYYGREVSGSAYPWCCVFVWWLFQKVNAKELFYNGGKTASCTTLMKFAKANGLWVTSGYKPGDLILYDFDKDKSDAEHVGICEEATKTNVTVIEGNTSLTNQDNGGSVMRRTRPIGNVIGAYRPRYKAAAKATVTKKVETIDAKLPVLKKGASGVSVKALQILLNGYGYNCGTVDGDFGTKTDTALRAYQKAKGLGVDGSCGPKSWCSLLGL